MTLLELLLQELPKRGGWPEGAICITQDIDFKVEPAACHPSVAECDDDGFWFLDSSRIGGFKVDTLASDYTTAIVTREQYEGAQVWGGTGLPPVGCECESKQFAQIDWREFRVVAIENGHVFGFWHDNVGACLDSTHWMFRPLRTEAERAIDEMVRLSGVSIGAAKILYDAGYRKA